MSGFKPYPAYKDTGIEWLDQVPGHWCNVPIKYMALERNSLFLDGDWIESKDISSDGIRYITTGNVGEGAYKEQGAGFISEETFHSLGCTEVYEGDVLVSRLNNPIGRACVVPDLGGRVVTSVDNVIFRPDSKFYKKFIVYLFSSEEYFKHTSNLARGATMQRISRGLLGNIRVVTPSLEEQTQIARFLDHETARIDALIEEQQRLIELLKEKRQAVISHAVTKGLDPSVPMKDSGVEWLGEVPAHWDVAGLTRFIGPVVDYRGRTPTKVDEGVFLVTARNIRNGRIDYEASQEYVDAGSAESLLNRGRPEIGDLLFTMEAPLGQVALLDRTDIALAQRIVKFRGEPHVMRNHYLLYWFMSSVCQARLETLATGSTALGIKASKLGMIECLAPTLREQDEVVSYIQREIAKSDTLVDEAGQVILLLQERRAALISAAVTGKIDVRGWQPTASVQAPELEEEAV